MPQTEVKREHMTIHVDFGMQEKIRAYSYWARKSIREIVSEALSEYFSDKKVDPLPTKDWHRTKKRKP